MEAFIRAFGMGNCGCAGHAGWDDEEEEQIMAGALAEVTTAGFDAFVGGTDVAVIDFSATWCGPCKVLTPTVEALAGELKDQVNIGKVDIDAEQDLAIKFSVMSVPTLLFFKGGKQVDSMIGVQPRDAIMRKIDALRN